MVAWWCLITIKNDKNGKMTIPTSPERKTEPRVSKIDPRKKALVIVIVPAPTSKESLFGNRQNKSLFLRFQRWLVLSYRGSPRVGRVVCPHLRVLNDLIFLLQLVNTLCKGVRCVMIIKKGGELPQKTRWSQRQLLQGECKGQSPAGRQRSSGRNRWRSFSLKSLPHLMKTLFVM